MNQHEMNFLFRRVAAYRGLVLSGYIIALLLAAAYLGLILTDYKTPSPLYLLFFSSVLPYLIRTLLEQKEEQRRFLKKEEQAQPLFPLFCKKYKFSSLRLTAASISYLIIFILLAAWRFSYVQIPDCPGFISSIPVFIAITGLCTRILFTLGYRYYFTHFPLRAMR